MNGATRSNAWWATLLLVLTEAALAAVVIAAYFYIGFGQASSWPPAGVEDPKLDLALAMTVAIALAFASARIAARRAPRGAGAGLAAAGTTIAAVAFLVIQALEYARTADQLTPQDGTYGSLFYAVSGLHAAHVVAGALIALWALVGLRVAPAAGIRGIRVLALFWTFIAMLWVAVLATLYLSPRL